MDNYNPGNSFRWISIVLLLLSYRLLPGITPPHTHFDSKDGLPSVEVYDACPDRDGRIWFATDRGLCTYDGYGFEAIEQEAQPIQSTVLRILPDPLGRLWFLTLGNALYRLEDGKLIPFIGNKGLQQHFFGIWIRDIVWDRDLNLVISSIRGGYVWVDAETGELKKQSFAQLKAEHADATGSHPDFFLINEKPIVRDSVCIAVSTGETPRLLKAHSADARHEVELTYLEGRRPTYARRFPSTIHALNLDRGGNLWVSTLTGTFYFPNADLRQIPQHYFPETPISRVVQDREGNYWLTSNGEGIFMVPSIDFVPFKGFGDQLPIQSVALVSACHDYLFVGTTEHEIWALDQEGQLAYRGKTYSPDETFLGAHCDPEGVMVGCTRLDLREGSLCKSDAEPSEMPGVSLKLANGDVFRGGYYGWNIRGYHERISKVSLAEAKRHRVECALEVGNTLWIGSMNGLTRIEHYHYEAAEWMHDTYPELHCRITDLEADPAGNLWIATLGKGLFYLTEDSLWHFGTGAGLNSNLLSKLEMDAEGALWVCSNQGINRIRYAYRGELLDIEVKGLDVTDGLPSNHVRGLAFWQGQAFVLSEEGLHTFSPAILNQEVPVPIIALSQVRVNDSVIQPDHAAKFRHHQNDVLLEFISVSSRKPISVPFYRYRLRTGGSTDAPWNLTNERRVHFNNLAPGSYVFEAEARNSKGVWSRPGIEYAFEISPHYSQRTWFQGLMAMGGLMVVSLVAMGWRRQVRNRNALMADRRFHQQAKELLEMQKRELMEEAEARKAEVGKPEARNAEAQKAGARNSEVRKSEARNTEAQKSEARNTEVRKSEARNTEGQKAEIRKVEARNTEAQKAGARNSEAQKSEERNTEEQKSEERNTEGRKVEAPRVEAQSPITKETL